MTHDDLVERASKWLVKKCPIVVTELIHSGPESPDAIGFKSGNTILIECKTSRSDFLSDAHKFFRRYSSNGMGDYRYYLTPRNLISLNELPDNWGLLEFGSKRINVVKEATIQKEKNYRSEQSLLVSCIRRLGKDVEEGINVKVYKMILNKTPKATLSLTIDEHLKAATTERC